MNRFHKALGFTIFVSIVAPAVAMWNEGGFGQEPYGGAGTVVESEKVLTDYEVQLADRRKKLRKPGEEASGAPAELSELPADTNAKKLPDSPDTQTDKILEEFYRMAELGAGSDSATSSADEGVASPIRAAQPEQNKEKEPVDNKTVPAIATQASDEGIKEPVASVPVPQIILPEGFDASSDKATKGDNSAVGSNFVSEDEADEAPLDPFVGNAALAVLADGEVASASSALIHPLEECPKITPAGDGEFLIDLDNLASDSDEDVQETSGEVGEEFSEEQVVENMMEEKVVLAPVLAPTLTPDVQDQVVPQLNPASAQNVPELAAPRVNGANINAQPPKIDPAVKPDHSTISAWKKVQGYFAVNYLKGKDNSRDLSFENLNQHKVRLLVTLLLYAATAGAVGGVVYGIANWFKKADKPAEPDAVPVKRPMVMAPRA